MDSLFTVQTDIRNRIGERESNRLVSNLFLRDLLTVLDTFSDNTSNLCLELEKLLSDYASDLEMIRWELARTPALFEVNKTSRLSMSGRRESFVGLKRGDYSIPLGNRYTPDSIQSLDGYVDGSLIWCLCSEEQTQYFKLPDIPCWCETESLVDWVTDYVMRQAGESSLQAETLPKKVRIYRYIIAKSPVKTKNSYKEKINRANTSRTLYGTLSHINRQFSAAISELTIIRLEVFLL